ncbi:MAG: CRISPR-associated endonuclease Cas2 [Bacteroidales bacterium]|nr:CRISPR-associated endonuclease Cas2 [Bacteroidales bacterium]
MKSSRLSEYRIMWVMCCFDLPVTTKEQRKAATDFRKFLLEDGFIMLQFSVYSRHCGSPDKAQVHINRVFQNLPPQGSVLIYKITDKQFSEAIYFRNAEKKKPPEGTRQLVLF